MKYTLEKEELEKIRRALRLIDTDMFTDRTFIHAEHESRLVELLREIKEFIQ